MSKISRCEICQLLPVKYIVRVNWKKLRICPLCFEEYRLNGIEPTVLETIKDSIEVEDWRETGIL